MAYTNKFILKADIQDLDTKLKSAQKSYTQAMDAMGSSTKQLTAAQKAYETSQSKTSAALQAQAERAKEVGVKAAKEEYAEKLRVYKLEEAAAAKEVARLKKVESARRRNVQLIKESLAAVRAEVSEKQALYAKLQNAEKTLTAESKRNKYETIQAEKAARAEESRLAGSALKERLAAFRKEKALRAEEKDLSEKAIQQARLERNAKIKAKYDAIRAEKESRAAESAAARNALKERLAAYRKEKAASRSLIQIRQAESASIAKMSNDVVRHIRHLESYFVAIYAIKKGYDATLGAGHEFNKLIEQETIGLKLLISQNLDNVDLQGRSVTALQRYTYAQKEAAKAIELARQINVKTPHSFKETLQIFKLLTPQVLKYGGTLEQTAEITQRMSVVAASMGIEFQQFLKTVDSALSGEMKESGLKRALEQFGVTNEGIKEIKKRHGDVVGYVIKGLQQAEAAGMDIFDGWSGTIGQFRNEWDDIWGQVQKPVFNLMKSEIKDYTLLLKENKKEIIDVVKFIGEHADDILALGGAYLLSSKYLAVYTKNTRASALATAMFGRNVTAMDIALARTRKSIVAIGASMKAMAASSGPMIALFAAFEAWSYYTESQNRQLEETKNILALTREELVKLNQVQAKQKKNTLLDQLAEVRTELLGFDRDWLDVLTGSAASGPDAERTKELKEQEIAILAQLEAMNKVSEAERVAVKELETQKKARQSLITEVSELNRAVEALRNAELPSAIAKREELEKQVEVKQKELDQTNENVYQLEETQRILGGVGIGYKSAADEAEGMAEATEKAAKAGMQLQQALLQGQLSRREISETDFNEQKFQLAWEQAESIADMDKRNQAEIKAFDEYETAMYQLRTQEAQAIADLEFQLLEKNGTKAEKIAKKKAILISQGIEGRQLELSLQVYAQSLEEKGAKSRKKSLDDYLKGLQEAQDKLAEARLTPKEFQLREIGQELNELGKYLTQAQLAEIYESELKKMNKANMDFTDQFENMLTALFEGDLSGAFEGFLNGMTTDLIQPFVTETAESLNASLSKAIGGGDLFGITGLGNALLGGALSLISSAFSDQVSQAEIDAAKGQVEFSDSSLRNLESIFESAQNPMLQVTNKMYKHLRNMDGNFYAIARAFSSEASANGVDLTGVNFAETAKQGFLGFSSKKTSLLGAGLQFEIQNLQQAMDDATLSVDSYTTKLVEKSSWFGLKNSSKIQETYKDLPPEIVSLIADNFSNGYSAILTAGVSLGLNEVDLADTLKQAEVDIGKVDFTGLSPDEVSQRLSDIFSTALSGIVDQVSDFSVLIERYAQNSEYSLETLTRIATEYDQGSFLFDMIGKSFKDGTYTATKTFTEEVIVATAEAFTSPFGQNTLRGWRGFSLVQNTAQAIQEVYTKTITQSVEEIYTAQMQVLDIIASTGGLTEFQDAMSAYMSNFFSEQEQVDFLTNSMSASFATLGLELPKTNAEFRKLLEEIPTATEEGAYLYGQVLLLADGFSQMTSAADALAEAEASALAAKEDAMRAELELIDAYSQKIADAWTGNLSYLTLQQKADYASRYFDATRQTTGALDTVESARLMAESALQTASTKEEYIPYFDKYLRALEEQKPKATTDDVVAKLGTVVLKLDALEKTIRKVG